MFLFEINILALAIRKGGKPTGLTLKLYLVFGHKTGG